MRTTKVLENMSKDTKSPEAVVSKFRSRKWILTWYVMLSSLVCLGTGLISSGEWVGLVITALGFFKAADVSEKWVKGQQVNNDPFNEVRAVAQVGRRDSDTDSNWNR